MSIKTERSLQLMKTNPTKELIEEYKKRNITISCAESFTGGLFASTLVSIPGCSKVFKGGITCYSIEAKTKLLGIKKELIDKYDVVSKETAEAMANNIKKELQTDIGVAFTGNAGPTKEKGKEKVGTVFISVSYLKKTETFKKIFNCSREKIRLNAVKFVIEYLTSKNFLSQIASKS